MLLSDHALRDVLLGKTGRDWLARPDVRGASVQFLRQQRRITARGSAEQAITYDAFLSYQHQDRAAVTRIVGVFAAKGLRTYSDQDLTPGENWEKGLPAGLQNLRALCVFIGAAAHSSSLVLREIEAASAQDANIPVIPVLLPGADSSKLPDYLRDHQWVDLREDDMVAEAAKLADFILSLR